MAPSQDLQVGMYPLGAQGWIPQAKIGLLRHSEQPAVIDVIDKGMMSPFDDDINLVQYPYLYLYHIYIYYR
jgi:hypothetical protein